MDGITMGRFVFFNPHGYWFKKTVYAHFYPQLPVYKKYQWIWDYFYQKNDRVYVYVNDHELTLQGNGKKNLWKWVLLNGLNPLKIKVIPSLTELEPTDILFLFQLGSLNLQYEPFSPPQQNIAELAACKAYKVMHLTHYGYHAEQASQYTRQAKIDLLISENNLKKNSKIFQHYYKWYDKEVFVLPFVPEKRFQESTCFEQRTQKAIATGQVQKSPDDIQRDFQLDVLHPLRKIIFDHTEDLAAEIDSRITLYSSKTAFSDEDMTKKNTLFQKIAQCKYIYYINFIKKILCAYLGINAAHRTVQNYHFDIVALMNRYTMIVHGKECMDLPPISAFEGMLCGCALIAEKDAMYHDLGFEDGISYIGVDGTPADLKKKINFYQKNGDILREIAQKGRAQTEKLLAMDHIARLLTYCAREMQKN